MVLWIPAILIAGVILLPSIYLVIRSLSESGSTFELIFTESSVFTIFRTLGLAASVTILATAISLPLAWITTRTDIPFRNMWRTLTPLPLVIPSFVGAYLLVSMIGPRGAVQKWLSPIFGIERLPEIYGFPGALLILTILTYPFLLLNIRSALEKTDHLQEEAARSLGLNRSKTFWKVIFPQIRPAIASGGLLVALYVLRDFGAVSVMRYNTFTSVIYTQYAYDRNSAATLALILISLTILILLFESTIQGKYFQKKVNAKVQKKAQVIKLGKWKIPALLFCFSVVFTGLIMPASNLLFWLFRGINAGEEIQNLWPLIRNSVTAALLAAVVTVLAAFPISILNTRYKNKLSSILERISFLAFALPGIVIALALVFFSVKYAFGLYQTLPLLVIAYVILFFPEAVGAIKDGLNSIHVNMEEAGRSLGKSPYQVFEQVTIPLLKPGIFTGFGLVFLTAMKELPATLILAPTGFKTLSYGVWDAVSEAFFAKAAAPALMIILISSIPMAILLSKKNSAN
jgi:iron(III) transport system permease protein